VSDQSEEKPPQQRNNELKNLESRGNQNILGTERTVCLGSWQRAGGTSEIRLEIQAGHVWPFEAALRT
jgi:hypothetical protein